MRAVFLLVISVCMMQAALTTKAFAGDSASLNVLGYSTDGKIFAFEEYGVRDGSGGPYSTIYLLDTEQDKFLPGTPFDVQVEDGISLASARKTAREKAEPLISKYQILEDPGVMVAYNPISEVGSDPHKLRFYEYISSPPRSQTATLELAEKKFPPTKNCKDMTGTFTGFTLKLTEYSGTAMDKVIYEDQHIPESRNCPNSYRIGAVINSQSDSGPSIAMVIVDSFGFEGYDQRWIAVPFQATAE